MGIQPKRLNASVRLCAKVCGAKCCKGGGTLVFKGGSKLIVPEGQDCPFLSDANLCKIYDDRPQSCRTFPTDPFPGCLLWPLEEP